MYGKMESSGTLNAAIVKPLGEKMNLKL